MVKRIPHFPGFKTMNQVAEVCQVTRSHILKDIRRGTLVAHRQGQCWYFKEEDVASYLETLKPQRYIPPSRDSERAAVLS